MKRNICISIFVLLSGMFLTFCAGPFTEKDNGRTINLGIDDPFEIELDGNPSTGYIWEAVSYDTLLVKQVGEVGFEPCSDAIGSGGKYTFRFQTVAAGQTTLVLFYYRKFEENKPPAKTFKLKVVSGTMGRILEE